MTAPGGPVGTFRLGHDHPSNDSLSIDLVSTLEGTRVAFSKAFDARAAIVVSTLSDALRADLPDWLSDEIFDLTFGGDPKPSLLIPHRAACAVDPKPVYRRLVQVEAGTVHGVVGAGRDESATAGQCLGQTRRPKRRSQLHVRLGRSAHLRVTKRWSCLARVEPEPPTPSQPLRNTNVTCS